MITKNESQTIDVIMSVLSALAEVLLRQVENFYFISAIRNCPMACTVGKGLVK